VGTSRSLSATHKNRQEISVPKGKYNSLLKREKKAIWKGGQPKVGERRGEEGAKWGRWGKGSAKALRGNSMKGRVSDYDEERQRDSFNKLRSEIGKERSAKK